MKRSARVLIPVEAVTEASQYVAAVRQIRQMVLERSEPGDHLAVDAKCRHAVGDARLRVRDNRSDRATESGKGASAGLLEPGQVGIDLISCHGEKSARCSRAAIWSLRTASIRVSARPQPASYRVPARAKRTLLPAVRMFNGRMGSRTAVGAAVAACLLALNSCSASSHSASPVPSRVSHSVGTVVAGGRGPAHPLDCGDYIGTDPPIPSLQVVLGVVALPTSTAEDSALQTALTGDRSLPRLFAKTGLLVRTGTDFQILVPSGSGSRLGIGWGSDATPSKAVVVDHCSAAGQRGLWLQFAGGYWLNHPACVALQVRTAQKSRTVHIGLGAPCPGQRPPPQPTWR
jgi:hypothetical protein